MFLKSAITLALFTPLFATDAIPPTAGLTVHEWGTFTSIAAEDGSAEPWASLSPPADLPCFVYHLSEQCVKCSLNRVRMETPVIYFYTAQPLTASVHVDFPKGLITEWYPQASHTTNLQAGLTYSSNGNIEWRDVRVTPGATAEFLNAGDRSHYYAARATDSTPLRVGDQAEKVLFYRGIADFDVALQPKFLADGKLELRNAGTESVGLAIVFENRGGKTGYRVIHDLRGKVVVDSPDLGADSGSVQQELAADLTTAGLYPKEAAAMVETWRDSWFEEGMRIFYLVPRHTVDTVLPIRITPAPSTIERVFVGRVELFSPWMQTTIETALGSGDTQTLAKYGRFLGPFSDRIIQGHSRVRISQAASNFLLHSAQDAARPQNAPCSIVPAALPTEQR
jgi:hypothetical protein